MINSRRAVPLLRFPIACLPLALLLAFGCDPASVKADPTPQTVATPTFDPPGGRYAAAQDVHLDCATIGAAIYYTLDPAENPTTASTLYSDAQPIHVGDGDSVTIRAIAVKDGMTSSAIAQAVYGINVPIGSFAVGYELAKEDVLRHIPTASINLARTTLHVAYFHTSHGTHVPYGLYGLQDYKTGDDALFGVSTNAEAGKLDFQDYYDVEGYGDLSQADADWGGWVNQVRAYLDDDANDEINVMMWSWCDVSGHDVAAGYLPSMQTLINEYGSGGSKIGVGTGKTKSTSVTFIFMTGHAYTDNVGERLPKNQADLITAYCREHGYLCLDYYSIETHDMNDNYWEDARDDSYSESYGGSYFRDWQNAHGPEGSYWFYNQSEPGGDSTTAYGSHIDDHGLGQHITSNRKAYAMWYILARAAGWDGTPTTP